MNLKTFAEEFPATTELVKCVATGFVAGVVAGVLFAMVSRI